MAMQHSQGVDDFTTVQSIFIRKRNCLLTRADFSPIFVDYYLNLMQNGMRYEEAEDTMFKRILAFFTLHLVSRPWREYHAWTINLNSPMVANYFVSGSSMTKDVVGRIFTRDVKIPERNMLFAQNLVSDREPQTSVIILPGNNVENWIEDYYRQSEQRSARAFELEGDSYALLTAQPDADENWLHNLAAEQLSTVEKDEETKLLETRTFSFRCGCTVDKILPTLRAMQSELADIISEQGYIEASCPRCGARYRITPEMLEKRMPPNSPQN